VSFVDETEMADLHVRFMDEEGPTDVLSFPLDEVDDRGVRLLGDVIIAPSVAATNNPDDPAGEVPPPAGARHPSRARLRRTRAKELDEDQASDDVGATRSLLRMLRVVP
jgi:hypothetical protein